MFQYVIKFVEKITREYNSIADSLSYINETTVSLDALSYLTYKFESIIIFLMMVISFQK